jgi:hypothetical protein
MRARRPVGMKELAELFDVDVRQVRRWINESALATPLRKGSSLRILDFPDHEIVRLFVIRKKAGKTVSVAAARRLGLEPLLGQAERRIDEGQPLQQNPSQFHLLYLRLLAGAGDVTAIAREQNKTPLEIDALMTSARTLMRGILANPASQAHLVTAFREALLIEASSSQLPEARSTNAKIT